MDPVHSIAIASAQRLSTNASIGNARAISIRLHLGFLAARALPIETCGLSGPIQRSTHSAWFPSSPSSRLDVKCFFKFADVGRHGVEVGFPAVEPNRADRLESQPCRRACSGEHRGSGGFQMNGLGADLDAVSGAVSQAFELGSCIPVLPKRENLVPVKDSYLVSFKPPPQIALIGHHHASHLDGDLQN